MGLDMYLTCNSRKVTDAAWGDSLPEPWRLVDGQVAYWRKANAIHNWFVEHVQEGEDDCGTYPVEVDDLEELHKTVCKVLDSTRLVDAKVRNGCRLSASGEFENVYEDGKAMEDPSVAKELLPTTEGFFFGGTDYDQWYWNNLEYTKGQIERILGAIEKVEYQALSSNGLTFTCWMPKGENDWEVKFQYHSSW